MTDWRKIATDLAESYRHQQDTGDSLEIAAVLVEYDKAVTRAAEHGEVLPRRWNPRSYVAGEVFDV
jgi:hypothetical protein